MHPVRPADAWVSVRLQRGNADDVLMCVLHGRDWRTQCGEGRGRIGLHAATVFCSAIALAAALYGSIRMAAGATIAWLVLVGGFAYVRIAPGPRTLREIGTMLLTSIAIPYAATYHRLRAFLALPRMLRSAGA